MRDHSSTQRRVPVAGTVLEEGTSCWKQIQANRLTVLVDAQQYFSALDQVLDRGQQTLYVAGWTLDSRARLLPQSDQAVDLRKRLELLTERNPQLHAYLLQWDLTTILNWGGEVLPMVDLDWRTGPRIRFALSDTDPVGAAHHQKIVVIDDAIAFIGGIDLTVGRWDTRYHHPNDMHRVLPGGTPYGPYHDMQVMVEGPVVQTLGELFRQRWQSATHEALHPPEPAGDDYWPRIEPDFQDISVGIVRTDISAHTSAPVRETEGFYDRALGSARQIVYLENQYLTAAIVADVLSQRLQEEDGPDVVIVLPRNSSSWLQQSTMDTHRAYVLGRLRQADRHDRLRVYYPRHGDQNIYVHAKALIVDDRILYIGSANLTNRSMGLDTECGIVVEAEPDSIAASAIAETRFGLLAEHLGTSSDEVRRQVNAHGSLVQALDTMTGGDRTLCSLQTELPSAFDPVGPNFNPADMEQPIHAHGMLALFLPEDPEIQRFKNLWHIWLGASLFVLAAAVIWGDQILSWTRWLFATGHAVPADNMQTWLIALGAYGVSSIGFVPLSVPLAVTLAIMPTVGGVAISFVGGILSALVMYGLGRFLKRSWIVWLATATVNKISKRLATRSVFASAELTFAYGIPYPLINLVSGANRISVPKFIGSAMITVSVLVLVVSLVTLPFTAFLTEPDKFSALSSLAAGVLTAGIVIAFRKKLRLKISYEEQSSLGSQDTDSPRASKS